MAGASSSSDSTNTRVQMRASPDASEIHKTSQDGTKSTQHLGVLERLEHFTWVSSPGTIAIKLRELQFYLMHEDRDQGCWLFFKLD